MKRLARPKTRSEKTTPRAGGTSPLADEWNDPRWSGAHLDCGTPVPLSEGPEAGGRSRVEYPEKVSVLPSPPPASRHSQSGRGLPQSK